MNRYAWCHVTFVADKVTSNVKTSYIKEVAEGQVAPKDLKIGKTYKVFWSPDPNETPQSLIDAGNDIIDVTSMTEKERKTAAKAGPLKGYFEAALLDLQQSEDSFCDVSKTLTSSKSRLKKPSAKKLSEMAGDQDDTHKAKTKHSKGKSSHRTKDNKSEKLAAEAASKANLLALIDKSKIPTAPLQKEQKSTNTSSSSGGSDTGSNHSGSSSDEEDKAEYWRKKFLELQKGAKTQKPQENTVKKPSKDTKAENASAKVSGKVTGKPTEPIDDPPEQGYEKPEDGCDDESEDSDSAPWPEVLLHKQKIKAGPAGDSLFCFNEAARLWNPKVLAIRSVTCLSSSRSPDAERGYPKLTPQKVDKIKGALSKRIKAEGDEGKARDKRLKKLHTHLAQKISTVRRSLRAKNITIPSSTTVWEVRDRDPQADGLSAYENQG